MKAAVNYTTPMSIGAYLNYEDTRAILIKKEKRKLTFLANFSEKFMFLCINRM